MDEPSQIMQRSLAWGSVCNYLDRISDIEKSIDGGWDELNSMVADVIADNEDEKSITIIFADIFNFIYNLYFRLKTNPTRREFNQVELVKVAGKEVYRITNYDYKAFKWAKTRGVIGGRINEDYINLAIGKLTDKERRALERRCK